MNRFELKQALLQGGFYLAIRQILSLALSLTSVLIITRTLGPVHYGWIAIALSCITFCTSLADMGLKVYLIRKPDDCSVQLQGEILAFLMASSGMLAIATGIISPFIAHWVNTPQLTQILISLAPAILLDSCSGVPLGLLERNLQYRRSSLTEIGAQIVYYTAAIPLVLIGWDIWGVVAAYLLRSFFQGLTAFAFYPVSPVWPSNLKALRTSLSYGISYSTSQWVAQSRGLCVSLLLGKFIGAKAVGLVSVTTRIADLLAFVKAIAWQLGISGFAKLQGDPPAMLRALSKAMNYQVFLLALPLGFFACLSPVLIPLVLGTKWNGVVSLFPFIGIAFLVKGIFDLHTLVLYSIGHNLEVFKFNNVNVLVICGAIVLLCKPFNIWGYAAAEMICLIVYVLLHQSVSRAIGSPNYRPVFWAIGCILVPFLMGPYLSPLIGGPLLASAFIIACVTCAELRMTGREFLSVVISRMRTT